MALEDPEFARKRVQLFRKGFSHEEITSIFEMLDSPNDLHNLHRIVDKCYEIMNESVNGNSESLGLIQAFVKAFMVNQVEHVNTITVTAKRKRGKWLFIVGAS